MRILLTNYLRDADEPASINNLSGGPIASARSIFDDYIGVEASDLTPEEIERYRPFAFDILAAEAKENLYLKVHDAFTYTSEGYPLISKASTKGVLYLVRSPLDVAVSFAHHNNTTVKRMIRKMGDSSYAFVAREDRLHSQLRQNLLTWREHVLSWVDEPDLNVLIVRYEDTKADPIASFTRVVRFCGLDDDPERIAKAVHFSSFETVKGQEQEKGFGEKMSTSKSFFRKGTTGGWRDSLTPEQATQIITDQQDVMRRLGYLDENDNPIY